MASSTVDATKARHLRALDELLPADSRLGPPLAHLKARFFGVICSAVATNDIRNDEAVLSSLDSLQKERRKFTNRMSAARKNDLLHNLIYDMSKGLAIMVRSLLENTDNAFAREHQEQPQQEQESSNDNQMADLKEEDIDYECATCWQVFDDETRLLEHLHAAAGHVQRTSEIAY